MHMDVDNSGPQQTSTSVAAAAGSTRGVLQKITVPSAQAQGLKQVVSSEIFLGSFVIFLQPYSFSLSSPGPFCEGGGPESHTFVL